MGGMDSLPTSCLFHNVHAHLGLPLTAAPLVLDGWTCAWVFLGAGPLCVSQIGREGLGEVRMSLVLSGPVTESGLVRWQGTLTRDNDCVVSLL